MGRLASAVIILLGLIVGLRVAVPYFQQQTKMTTNRGTPQVTPQATPQVTPQPRSTGFSFVKSNLSSPGPSASPTIKFDNTPTPLPTTPYPPNSSGPPQGVRGGW